jgi:hypothetical protein
LFLKLLNRKCTKFISIILILRYYIISFCQVKIFFHSLEEEFHQCFSRKSDWSIAKPTLSKTINGLFHGSRIGFHRSYWNLMQQDFVILYWLIPIFSQIRNQALYAKGPVWLMWKPCGIWAPHNSVITNLFSRLRHTVTWYVVLKISKGLQSFETSGTT